MILIVTDRSDKSTVKVQKWLHYYNLNYIVIYPDTNFRVKELLMSSSGVKPIFDINGTDFTLEDFSCKWYRRGIIPIDYKSDETPKGTYTINEYITLGAYIVGLLNTLPGLNDIGQGNFNKLQALHFAVQSGFNIPSTLISESKKQIEKFGNAERLITKGIYGESFRHGSHRYSHGTKELFIDEINVSFTYTLVQKLQSKKYELRVFYLDGKFYSMAIFSQSNKESEIDWRGGNYLKRKNRQVPYNLPGDLQNKIKVFMKTIGMNCGSLDFIKTKDNNYIFLEINPIGQYDWVSHYCNYDLHRLIVEYLKEKELMYLKNRNDEKTIF